MGVIKTSFNILKWTVKGSAAAAVVGAAVMSSQDIDLKSEFNALAAPDIGYKELEIVDQNGSRIYKGDKEIKTAILSLPFKDAGIPGNKSSERRLASVQPQDPVSEFMRIYQSNDPLAPIMDRLIFSESGDNPDAVSHTGARGLGQFVGDTFLEQLWHNKDTLPPSYQNAANAVERYMVNEAKWKKDTQNVRPVYGYRVQSGFNKESVMELAHDPVIGRILSTEYSRHLIEQARDHGSYKHNLSGLCCRP
jgi:hypothetical protein